MNYSNCVKVIFMVIRNKIPQSMNTLLFVYSDRSFCDFFLWIGMVCNSISISEILML